MSEVVDTGGSLWPVIFLALYWAYLLVWHERQKQNGQNALFNSGLPPPEAKEREGEHGPLSSTTAVDIVFDEEGFLVGARKAYELILKSYAAGSIDALAPLVSPEVLEAFAEDINRRKAKGEQLSLAFVSLKEPVVLDKEFDEAAAEVKVRFEADIFLSEGKASSTGSQRSTRSLAAVDLWTFRKEHQSGSQAWTLVATDTE